MIWLAQNVGLQHAFGEVVSHQPSKLQAGVRFPQCVSLLGFFWVSLSTSVCRVNCDGV